MNSLVRALYRLSRLLRDLEVLVSGSPSRIARRAANKAIGRYLVRRLWLRPRR